MKPIFVDEQNFEKLRRRGGLYVDKTELIYQFLKQGTYFIAARPRRFGKSLLCSTLAELFKGNRSLFKGLWIDSSDWQWKQHPVIHLDMTAVSSGHATPETINADLLKELQVVAHSYGITTIDANRPAPYFSALIRALHEKTNQNVVVIIDEYDKPMLDVIEEHPKRFNTIRNTLRPFYAKLKQHSPLLECVFLTGVYKFTQTSIFSGLNNLIDLTFLPETATLFGYTDQEVVDNFSDYLAALTQKLGIHHTEAIALIKQQYNGYRFGYDTISAELSPSVYNPFALGGMLVKQQLSERWFESGSANFLISSLQKRSFVDLDPNMLRIHISALNGACSFETLSTLTILYYAGYLTIKQYNTDFKELTLDFPNSEVSEAFSRMLLPAITNKDVTYFSAITRSIMTVFKDNALHTLKDTLNTALAQLPYYLFDKKEQYYQTVIYILFSASNLTTIAEDMTNAGRADITVKTPRGIYIFELKMSQTPQRALEQIKDRGYAEKYRLDPRPIYLVGVQFAGRGSKVVKDILIEQAQ